MRRTLVLKKETLADLTPAELHAVVAGNTGECIEPPSNVCMETYQAMCLISRMMDECVTDRC